MADNSEFETDEAGQVILNKDGTPRKKRGRKTSPEPDATPAPEPGDTGSDTPEESVTVELKSTQQEEPVRVEHLRGADQVLAEAAFMGAVTDELEQVFQRFGPQNHIFRREHRLAEYRNSEFVQKAQYRVDAQHDKRHWDNILLEEVFEALASDNAADAYDELVQVAAMAGLAAISVKRNGL